MDLARSEVEPVMTSETGAIAASSSPVARAHDEAFVTLYDAELAGQVRRATVVLSDADLARDVVHDAFIEVYRRWGLIDEPARYLNTAVMNGCRTALHASSRTTPGSRDEAESSNDDVLFDVLARLPFKQHAALVLRYHCQLTEREIAEVLGCRVGSVGPWIHRGLQRLRKELSR